MAKKPENDNLDSYPNEKYKKFFEKFNEINTLPVKDWKPIHLLAYFDNKYYNHYNSKYTYKYNSPSPANCFEIFIIKKISLLLTSNPISLKDYIDWVFENKVKKAKRKLTSISFLATEDIINFYKLNYLLKNTIDRSSNLPEDIKNITHVFKINTYGELAFLWQSLKISNDSTIKEVFDQLKELNFDFNLLDNMK